MQLEGSMPCTSAHMHATPATLITHAPDIVSIRTAQFLCLEGGAHCD
jgi:hypothetical protein